MGTHPDHERVQNLFNAIEDHVGGKYGQDQATGRLLNKSENLERIGEMVTDLVGEYKKIASDKGLNLADIFKSGTADQVKIKEVLQELFGVSNRGELNFGQRLVFLQIVSDAFYTGGKSPSMKEVGQRFGLMVQLMLGRIGGLEAGGGKTILFILAMGEHAMREENRAGGYALELIVFTPGEIHQYLTKYLRPFSMRNGTQCD